MYSDRNDWLEPVGFPHSEISGSLAVCASPKLIAAYHVLHRLHAPRHPPCALSSLTIKFARANSVSTTGFLIRLVNHRYFCEPVPLSGLPLRELTHSGTGDP